jgi:hypothetical protein
MEKQELTALRRDERHLGDGTRFSSGRLHASLVTVSAQTSISIGPRAKDEVKSSLLRQIQGMRADSL